MKEQLNPMNCQNETLQKTKLGCGALKPSVCPCETALSLSLSLYPSDASRHPKESHRTNRNNSPDLQYSLKYRDAARCTIE